MCASRQIHPKGLSQGAPEPGAARARRPGPPAERAVEQGQLLRLAADLVWEADAGLRFTHVSGRFLERTGRDGAQLVGRSLGEGSFMLAAETLGQSAWKAIRARQPFSGLTWAVPDAEPTCCVRLSGLSILDEAGAFCGYRGVGVDVTPEVERWLGTQRLLKYYVNIIETISEGLALFDAEDRLVVFNQKYWEIHQRLADVIHFGVSFEDIARAAAARGVVIQAIGREEEWVRERMERHRSPGIPVEQKLDSGRWVLVSERKLKDGSTVSVRTDVTELKQREIAHQESEARAAFANRAKSEFLANMSHELRTPLNAVIGFAEGLESGLFGELSTKQRSYLRDIRTAATHLLGLINDILDISKVEAGSIELCEGSVDLRQVVETCTRLMRTNAQAAGIRLEARLCDPPVVLRADDRRLRQVLLNLLSNAVKFTPSGGRVTVELAVGTRDVVLRISDTGIGIRADSIAACLEPFYQVESAMTRQHQGTGLGLPLSKRMVECHGGSLELESALGKGTTVTVRLPVRRLEAADEQAAQGAP